MRWLNILWARLRALAGREAVLRDIDEELRLHLEMETEANVLRGMARGEARRAALLSFGNFDVIRDAAYGVRGGGIMETLLQDVRYGARVLAKHKGFTFVAVLTLALGIGANTAIFSVVNELLLRPMPFRDADRIVMLWEVSPRGNHQNTTSRANFLGWREQAQSFEAIAAFSDQRANLTGVGDPEEVTMQMASSGLFNVLGVDALVGRTFTKDDIQPGASRVAVLSYGLWQRRFGGDRGVVGRPVTLNGEPYTVIGVMPANFQWHLRSKSGTGRPAEVWTILTMPTSQDRSEAAWRGRFLTVVGRLKPGVPVQQADAELKTVEGRMAEDAPKFNKGFSAEVIPVRDQLVGDVRPALWLLLGAVGFVLLIACANVANLLLARAASREREIAVRTALGARRSRIVRQLLTESVMLSVLGGLLGLGLAWWGIQALVAMAPREIVSLQGVGLNLTVLGWTLAVTLLTGVVFGLVPALEATRVDLNDTLKEGGKGGGGQSARSRTLRGALVVAEVALALVLLVSAGLLVKSFARMRDIDTGFNTANILTMVVRLPEAKYNEDPKVVAFFGRLLERVRAMPGVRSAGMVNYLPLYGGLGSSTGFSIEGRPEPPPDEKPGTSVRVADSAYFQTMGIPLLRGRNFTEFENAEARHVVLVSDSFARKYFPGEDPVGKRVSINMFEKPNPTEIIGVVGDVRYDSLTKEAEPTAYFPLPELTYSFMTLVIHTDGDPAALAPAVRREVSAIDPDQPVSDVRTMVDVMADTVGRARFSTLLFGLFAGLATLLAAVGIFGVMNYSVTLRTRELGLRMALGAQPRRVLLLVLRQGLLLTLVGVGVGVAGALALTRVMSSLLFGVEATDPLTFAAIVPLLTLVSLAACYLPARRATRIDPLIALRYE